jgi:thiaminase
MGRSPFARNNALWMSVVATVVGLVLTVLAFAADYGAANWTDVYEAYVSAGETGGNWNRLVQVLAPVVLATGLWYVGEQILARRSFNELIDTDSKSEFQSNLEELEDTVGKLPKSYEERLQEKREQFVMRREP